MGSLDIAADNAATGADMLATLEDNYSLISSHLQRVRDLAEQAANGTYGTESKNAIEAEITARLQEIDRIAANCEFNGINLMAGGNSDGTPGKDGLDIQVGIEGTDTKSRIHLDNDLFAKGSTSTLLGANIATVASRCSGKADGFTASSMLATIDAAISTVSNRVTKIGAGQNRLESAIESISVQTENITSSLSTLRDADVATESSNYIKAQILQQASATLLATANQTPAIALNLL